MAISSFRFYGKGGDLVTKRTVFWVFFSFLFLLLALVLVSGLRFFESRNDLVMLHLFLYGAIAALVGGKVGGVSRGDDGRGRLLRARHGSTLVDGLARG